MRERHYRFFWETVEKSQRHRYSKSTIQFFKIWRWHGNFITQLFGLSPKNHSPMEVFFLSSFTSCSVMRFFAVYIRGVHISFSLFSHQVTCEDRKWSCSNSSNMRWQDGTVYFFDCWMGGALFKKRVLERTWRVLLGGIHPSPSSHTDAPKKVNCGEKDHSIFQLNKKIIFLRIPTLLPFKKSWNYCSLHKHHHSLILRNGSPQKVLNTHFEGFVNWWKKAPHNDAWFLAIKGNMTKYLPIIFMLKHKKRVATVVIRWSQSCFVELPSFLTRRSGIPNMRMKKRSSFV